MGREHSCCFTGHRPQKLPWGFDETDQRCEALKRKLRSAIKLAITHGITMFYTGMAMGTDLWAAEIVLDLREELQEPGIRLVAVIPHSGQESKYPEDLKERYREIIGKADDTIVLQDHYTDGCMQRRNRFMIDNSSMLIAVYSGDGGGTGYTFDYAKERKLKIIWIDPVTGRIKTNFNIR